jgi:hypothetical protein
VPRHADRRDRNFRPGEFCNPGARETPGAPRPTAGGSATFTDVGSADVRSQVTIQPAPFMRKSSVWVAQRGRGPGRLSRMMDAAARRPGPSLSAPEALPDLECFRPELVAQQPTGTGLLWATIRLRPAAKGAEDLGNVCSVRRSRLSARASQAEAGTPASSPPRTRSWGFCTVADEPVPLPERVSPRSP